MAPDASRILPRVWEGVEYRPLDDLAPARDLFAFAAAAFPTVPDPTLALGAWAEGARLVGAVVAERAGTTALLSGPVVASARVEAPAANTRDANAPLEIAEQLVGAAVDHATANGVETIFARPQGLDRIWVRFGFIPVPEVALPEALRGRPGAGLFAYRRGSALWSWRESVSEEDRGFSPAARRRRSPRSAT